MATARRSRRCRARSSLRPAAARSASRSRSISNGWARSCSSGFTPMMPRARRPRISMRSSTGGPTRTIRAARAPAREPSHDVTDAVAPARSDRAAAQAGEGRVDRRRAGGRARSPGRRGCGRSGSSWRPVIVSMIEIVCGPSGHHARPADVATDDAGDPVADLVGVHHHLRAVGQHLVDLGVERRSTVRASSPGAERAMEVGHARTRRSCGGCACEGMSEMTQPKPCSRSQMISSWRRTRRWLAP